MICKPESNTRQARTPNRHDAMSFPRHRISSERASVRRSKPAERRRTRLICVLYSRRAVAADAGPSRHAACVVRSRQPRTAACSPPPPASESGAVQVLLLYATRIVTVVIIIITTWFLFLLTLPVVGHWASI